MAKTRSPEGPRAGSSDNEILRQLSRPVSIPGVPLTYRAGLVVVAGAMVLLTLALVTTQRLRRRMD